MTAKELQLETADKLKDFIELSMDFVKNAQALEKAEADTGEHSGAFYASVAIGSLGAIMLLATKENGAAEVALVANMLGAFVMSK